MEQSALILDKQAPAEFIESPPIQIADASNIIAYPAAPAVSIVDRKRESTRNRKRRGKLMRFIVIEATACFFLVLALSAGTSKQIVEAGLMLPFEIMAGLAILAVAIVPVLFYGSTHQQHRYRRSRD